MMTLLQAFKNKIGNYFLSKEVSLVSRNKMFVNLGDAKTIGIVFNASEKEQFELVKKYINYLKDLKKRVKAIGFFNSVETPLMTYSKLEYDFFSLKDLNWYNTPKNVYVSNFIEDQFDILIDLNMHDSFPLTYISTLSRAKFKVGKKSSGDHSIFDLMLEIDSSKSLKYFMRNLDEYLFVINKEQKNTK